MPNVTSSVIKPSYMKPIDSVTYGANSEFIALAAVTEIPYTNDEYMNLVLEMEDVLYEVNDEVTEENAQLVFDGCSAVLDLIKRGYDMPAEETERYRKLKVLANNILNGESGEIIFEKPVITISDDVVKAEAKMKNTTANVADYILILAAYDENGSLVGIKASAQSELAAGTQEYTESVSMSIAENAVSYKAFVWKDMQGIVPLAYGELL